MMALARDLSSLPKVDVQPDGSVVKAADTQPRFARVLVDKWDAERKQRDATRGRGGPRSSPFWLSDAGKCSRYLALSAMSAPVPPGDDMDLSGVWNVNLGNLIHEEWQAALVDAFPGAEVETRSILGDPDRPDASGYCDATITLPNQPVVDEATGEVEHRDWKVVVELKSIGGYGYKASIGKANRSTPATGAKPEHLLQAALNGLAEDADEVVVAYLAKECISVNQAKGLSTLARFSSEWSFDRAEYEPLALAELERAKGIAALLDAGEVAARKAPELPPGAEVTDPVSGEWRLLNEQDQIVDVGTYWACAYCRHASLCREVGPGRVDVDVVIAAARQIDPEFVYPPLPVEDGDTDVEAAS